MRAIQNRPRAGYRTAGRGASPDNLLKEETMGRAWQRPAIGAGALVVFLSLAFGVSVAAASGGAGTKPMTLHAYKAATSTTTTADATKVKLDVSAQRFVVRHGDVYAKGPVTATAIQPDGTKQVETQRVRLKVGTTHKCRILTLHLAPLYLNLLGLQVRTSDINVKITGDRHRLLGSLFCSLSRGIKLSRLQLAQRTTHSLNQRLQNRPLHVLRFSMPVYPQQQPTSGTTTTNGMQKAIPPVPPGSCEVLDLLVGPLHLDLLGLIVDVYGPTTAKPVEVLVTADPNGGLLGSLLCTSQ